MRHLKNVRLTRATALFASLALGITITVGLLAHSVWGQIAAPAPIASSDYYSSKLGIYYQFPYYQGNIHGVRLTRYPVPQSPASLLQLEPGDMIISMDGLPFYTPNDVDSHYGQTSMIFINIRTNMPQSGNVYLP